MILTPRAGAELNSVGSTIDIDGGTVALIVATKTHWFPYTSHAYKLYGNVTPETPVISICVILNK
jgi:hypothetical protein